MRLLLFQTLAPKFCLNYFCQKFVTSFGSEYSNAVEYPTIDEVPLDKIWLQKKRDWIQKVKNLPTVEQKLMELNMPKYYGYWSSILDDHYPKIICSDYLKFITRTHVVPALPEDYYLDITVNVDHLVQSLKSRVEDVILAHSQVLNKQYLPFDTKTVSEKYNATESLIQGLNCVFMEALSENIPHLSPASIDLKPRIEGCWFVGGYEMKNHAKHCVKNLPFLKPYVAENTDIPVRSRIHPTIALRTKYGLPSAVPIDDTLATSAGVPIIPSLPVSFGVSSKHKAACIIPGFWPGVSDEHGQLFIHPRFDAEWRCGNDSRPLIAEFQSLLACFTQAHSYAFYQGFTPFNELTYPFVQQTITTDGRMCRFHLYQFNTCVFHSEFSKENKRNNILWMTEDIPLYETVENDTVKGLNDDALKTIVLMYLKKGRQQEDANPYLSSYKYLMHHQAPKEYKKHFHEFLLDVCSERRTRQRKPYIAPWEKIYKIYFKTRAQDAKKKFFEFRQSKIKGPSARRLDYYKTRYIPRVNRRNPKIKKEPRIDSEKLFVHDYLTIRKAKLYPDDKIAFRSFNILPNSERYRSGKSDRKWTRLKKINYVGDEDEL